MVGLLARLAKGRYSQEGPLAVCMINYEGNPYDMNEILGALPATLTVIVVDVAGPFMKAPGLQKCIDALQDDDIAFILDVDVEVDDHLLRNIRRAVSKGESFFTPIVNYDSVDSNGTLYEDSPVGYATMGTGLLGAYV